MDEKEVSVSKKGATQPCQQSVNIDHEQSLGNCVCDGIDIIYIYIYIMMAHNIKIFFFHIKYLMTKYWWGTSYEFVVRIFFFWERLIPHPNVSEFHLLSYLTPPPPFISPYKYIRGIIGVQIPGSQ